MNQYTNLEWRRVELAPMQRAWDITANCGPEEDKLMLNSYNTSHAEFITPREARIFAAALVELADITENSQQRLNSTSATDDELQRFWVRVENLTTGEKREQSTEADTPERALQRIVSRKWVAEWLMSEDLFRFRVT